MTFFTSFLTSHSMERYYIADDIPGFLKKYRPDTCYQQLDNNLEFGDNLTFSYIGNFNFFRKNGFMKNNLTANEELKLHPMDEEHAQAIQEAAPLADQAFDGSLNSVVAISLFEVVMKKSDFLKMMFNILAAFGNKYMKRGQKFEKIATLQIDSKSWQVTIRSYDRLKFRNGWLDFVGDNKLRVGYVLRFKLIDEENFIMKVRIRRNPSLNEV